MKRRYPNTVDRIIRGKVLGISVGVGTATLLAFFNTTSGITGLKYFVVSAIVVIVVGLIAAYIGGRLTDIPSTIVEGIDRDGKYKIHYDSEANLRESCEITREIFGRDYIAPEVAEQWRLKNPTAFVSLVNEHGHICCGFGTFALEHSCFDEFIKGRLSESDLTSDDIMGPAETKNCNRLYISGVFVRDPKTAVGQKRALPLLWGLLEYHRRRFGLRKERDLYALAVTKEGEQLLKKFNFSIASSKDKRKDRHDLYHRRMNRQAWNEILQKVGNWSATCEISLPDLVQ
jgi:hypothetical protein